MNAELKYNGYTAQPSDYECQDGDLGIAMNLMPKEGRLRPILPAKALFYLNTPNKVVCVHETNSFKHYITLDANGNICYVDHDTATSGGSFQLHSVGSASTSKVYQITAIGNTLVVLTAYGCRYFLWDADNTTYKLLGSMPEMKLSFGLQCRIKKSDRFTATFNGTTVTSDYNSSKVIPKVADSGVSALTSAVLAQVNKIISQEVQGSEMFCMPFFVRYAYRLYDGTLTRQSAPILMVPNSGAAPKVFVSGIQGTDPYVANATERELKAFMRVYTPAAKLDVACIDNPSNLTGWSDIIKSIDIFVSSPIYDYDQNGQCDEFALMEEDDKAYGFFMMDNLDDKYSGTLLTTLKKYSYWRITDAIRAEEGDREERILKLPTKGLGVAYSEIANCAAFYFLKSIPIEDLSTTRKLIEIDEGYLNALVTRETLPDDYDSHDTIIAKRAFNYNARLILSGLKKSLFAGYFATPYVDGVINPTFPTNVYNGRATDASLTQGAVVSKVYVYIKRDGRDIIMEETVGDIRLPISTSVNISYSHGVIPFFHGVIPFFYHPDPNAYKAVVYFNGSTGKIELTLKTHEHLAGGFYFDSFGSQVARQANGSYLTPSDDTTIEILNKIYNSEINNPFFFPLLGITTVGTSEILGVSTAAKALSQGQFGQFPLYAFTKEGVWSIEISSTGTFSARQPITRDVCINPDSITQIDSAVLFATDRGIMLIAGSQTQCISETIDTDIPDSLSDLPLGSSIFNQLGISEWMPDASALDTSIEMCFDYLPFKDFLKECLISYDYTHQRAIVFNPSRSYAYVYSFESKAWGIIWSDYDYTVNSYPNALVVTKDESIPGSIAYTYLCDFAAARPNYQWNIPVLLATRPLKLDPSLKDVHKTIDTIIQRGHFLKGSLKQVLYGSRDLQNWFPIYSSVDAYLRGFRGTPYKYFKIVVFGSLKKDESIWGSSIQYTPKLTNQPR